MATLHEAQMAQDRAWTEIQSVLHIRPSVVGLIRIADGGFGLNITLPFDPGIDLPTDLLGVPARYTVSAGPPELAAGKGPSWIKRIPRPKP